jgi:hypothetical protein
MWEGRPTGLSTKQQPLTSQERTVSLAFAVSTDDGCNVSKLTFDDDGRNPRHEPIERWVEFLKTGRPHQ